MFTPEHRRAAGELLRVTRSGGRIALANWTPEGFIGDLFRLVGTFNGPTYKAYAALDAAQQVRLTQEITQLLERLNVGGANSLVVPGE